MHLISALLSGIRGAENGSAKLWRRGTSTRATWYEDFEATSANSTGSDIALDENGGAVVYVNELVQVQVYDEQGSLVRDFVAGEGAYAVELISPSFTGTDYVTGQSGTSKPTTVGAALDLWNASAGGVDFQGLYSGVSTQLKNIFGAIYGLFYNVKSPEYGAVGNGVVDDVAAIQAAHDDALAAGGGIVVLPPGIYNCSVALNWNLGVSLVAAPGTAQLSSSSGADMVLNLNGSSFFGPLLPCSTVIYGVEFTNTINNTGANVFVDYNSDVERLYFINCRFGGAAYSKGVCLQINSEPGAVVVSGCLFDPRDDKSCIRHVAAASQYPLIVEDCVFNFPAVAATQPMVYSLNAELHLRNCQFLGSASSGNCIAITPDVNAPVIVTGCRFKKIAAGATNYALKITNAATVQMSDDCSFDAQTVRYYKAANTDVLSDYSYLPLQPHNAMAAQATPTTLVDGIECHTIAYTSGGTPTITLPKIYRRGQICCFTLQNNTGAPFGGPAVFAAPAGVTARYNAGPIPTLGISEFMACFFRSYVIGGSLYWVQQAGWANPG